MRVAAHEIFVFDLRKHPRKSIIFLSNLLKEDGFVKRGFTRLTRKQSGKQKKIEPDTLPLRDWFDLPRKQEGQGVFFRQNFGICFHCCAAGKRFRSVQQLSTYRTANNNYPPAKPGVLHRRAKPWNTSARVTSRWYGLPAARVCYLPPVNGLIRSFPSSVVPLPGPLRVGAGYILRFSLHFCPLYLRMGNIY